MQPNRRERGEGKIGCVLWTLALILAAMVAWKMVPVKIASAQMHDFMEDQAKFAANTPPDEIKRRILVQAKDLELPITEKQVVVQRVGDSIRMSCTYTVPVDLPFYTYNWSFNHQVNRPIFIF